MKIKVFDSYKKAMAVAAGSWTITGVIVAGRAVEYIPQNLGATAIFTIGLGIASSVSISRFRLTKAITEVFRIGMAVPVTYVPPLPAGAADRLIDHLKTCADCREGRYCAARAGLVRETTIERHGAV